MRKKWTSRNDNIRNLSFIMLLLSVLFLQHGGVQAEQAEKKLTLSEVGHFTAAQDLPLTSQTAILVNANTGQVLYEKNASQQMYPASITKIVTGIIAIEQGNLDDIVTVSEKARNVDGTRVYLEEGEQVTLLKLVQGLLINSGNDAGTAIAEHMDQSEELFAERMNRFLTETVGVQDTHFSNPHGLFAEDHYTTAFDMAMITKYAMQNDAFRQIVGTYEMEWIGESWATTLYNHNRLLNNYEGATGVKNGFVNQSGPTLVGSAERDGSAYIAVTLQAATTDSMYRDMQMLLDYGFENFDTHLLSSESVFLDSKSVPHKLTEDIAYSVAKNETPNVEMNDAGYLDVWGDGDRKLFEVEILPVDTSSVERKQNMKISGHANSVEEAAHNHAVRSNDSNLMPIVHGAWWVTVILYALFLLLIAYLLIRKKRRQKRERFRRIPY
ncbi:D-alanyl-D-alanine carboxypeptidase family protein [Bacillus horti]|uniref:D-alanyl-D-alanine carboxypeptidase/D-alanyl-D-alanine carboxypeptidase (Penicillin-binding protein 5/6) n=1 Tax=Caldalkalibacillus horti TaxID=77523 RepID=A0ABT9W528_9BACI|nr:D-alanyl-D-alanine carboxypeptidase family protein [Bacillus horti]MDQ0168344.1 D-alanyl-D-alanine carboxypeptidase/D-alanyl-D-alanine carboxypeptidase (penicillin-binding protein 5/6) [Bacillus horti]